MKPIDLLGLKNFRVFDDHVGIFEEMAPINILSGANNSGKSSIIKALQMVKNSVRGNFPFELDLSEQEHLLGNFENVLHKKDNKELVISLPFTFLGLTKLFISLTFEVLPEDTYKAKLRKIEVVDNTDNRNLFQFSYREATKAEKAEDNVDFKKELQEYEDRKNGLDKKKKGSYGYGLFQPFENPLSGYVDWSINSGKLKQYLIELREVYIHYLANKKKRRWLENADDLFDDRTFPLLVSTFVKSFKNEINVETWKNFVENILVNAEIKGKEKVGERDFEPDDYFFPVPQIEDILYYKSLEILKTKLKWKETDGEESTYDVLENCFKSSWDGLSQRILSINYLSTVREQNSRIYSATTSSPFINLLKDYYPLQGDRRSFLNRYLRSFEIGEKLVVDYQIDYQLIFASVTTFDESKRELVDFGYGIKQLILILIQISVLAGKNVRSVHDYGDNGEETIYDVYDPSVLLIEEPESNLHPKWQSLLAEMFVEANQKYNIQFIIESHSEYMIRKFQTLVANKTINAKSIKLFYLRDKKLAVAGKKQFETVLFEDDGSIDYKVFEDGFFDEADNLELSLLNIRRENFINDFQALKIAKAARDQEIADLGARIDSYITKLKIDGYRQILEQLFDVSKLSSTTVVYLTSAQFLLATIDESDDFSPVIIQYGRALEYELKKIFVNVDSAKRWTIGEMQGSLEKFKNGRNSIRACCSARELRILRIELGNMFDNASDLKINLINDLREIRNAAGHGSGTKTSEEARDYILKANEFFREWVTQKKV